MTVKLSILRCLAKAWQIYLDTGYLRVLKYLKGAVWGDFRGRVFRLVQGWWVTSHGVGIISRVSSLIKGLNMIAAEARWVLDSCEFVSVTCTSPAKMCPIGNDKQAKGGTPPKAVRFYEQNMHATTRIEGFYLQC